MTDITISSALLAAVAKWTSTDETRPHLRQVLFTRNECVACDGHRLVRVPTSYDGPSFGVDRDHLLAADAVRASLKHSDRDVTIACSGSDVTIAVNHPSSGLVRLVVRASDSSKFPPYEQVMPKERPNKAPDGYGFNPKYLAAIHEIEEALGVSPGRSGVKVTGWSSDGLGAMLFEGYQGARYVIMPVRV